LGGGRALGAVDGDGWVDLLDLGFGLFFELGLFFRLGLLLRLRPLVRGLACPCAAFAGAIGLVVAGAVGLGWGRLGGLVRDELGLGFGLGALGRLGLRLGRRGRRLLFRLGLGLRGLFGDKILELGLEQDVDRLDLLKMKVDAISTSGEVDAEGDQDRGATSALNDRVAARCVESAEQHPRREGCAERISPG
jgi:hypothetical protein